MKSSFDSQAEKHIHPLLSSLGFARTSKVFPQIFVDDSGTSFQVCPDFYSQDLDLYLEYKAAPLNGVKRKKTADASLAHQKAFSGVLKTWHYLRSGWNHSRFKQAIVQRKLTPQNFIVVFRDDPTSKEANSYIRDGLVFVPQSALPSFLGYIKLLKRGVPCKFMLSYFDNGEFTDAVL